jgi:mono/diheme cytochrome c family protein
MRTVRISAMVLAAGLTLSAISYAQTAPEIALPAGDATRGKTIFESSKANCQSCHRVNGVGSLFGPDLSAIGAPPRGGGGGRGGGGAAPAARGGNAAGAPATVPPVPDAAGRGGQAAQGGGNAPAGPTPSQLAQSILDPNAVVSAQNRYVLLKMKDGKTITGKLLSVDTFAVQIFDSNEKLANISKDNVREMTMTSPMPSYRDKLSTQELADVVSYLISLKGQ